MENILTISEASKVLNVSSDTIRRWDKKGLIKAIRSELNYRLFNIEELKRISQKIAGTHKGNNYRILKNRKKSSYTAIELFAGTGGTAYAYNKIGAIASLANGVVISSIDVDGDVEFEYGEGTDNVQYNETVV